MPEEFQETLVEELDYLLHWHERILMRFVGRIKTQDHVDLHEEGDVYKQHLTESFLKNQDKLKEELLDYNMLTIMASTVEYREQLEHLETLLSSFQTYHKKTASLKLRKNKPVKEYVNRFLFSFLHFRIKGVAQAVSHQIKAENGQHDRKSRKNNVHGACAK